MQLLRKAVVLLRRILLAGAGGQRAPQPAYLLPGARACSNPVWKLLKYLAGMGCNARGAAIDPASLNLKCPFGLSLSKPRAALRRVQRERFKQIRAGSIVFLPDQVPVSDISSSTVRAELVEARALLAGSSRDVLHNSLQSVIARSRAIRCVAFLAHSPAMGCKKTPCSLSRSALPPTREGYAGHP